MGCTVSLTAREANYSVTSFKEGTEDQLYSYDKHWPTLPQALLLRIAAEARIGAWRLNLVCQAWQQALQCAPRTVRFQAQDSELNEQQVEWVRKAGDDAAQWRVEAVGDKGAAAAADALRCNAALREFGVYRGRRKEGALGVRGASKLSIAIAASRGLRMERIDLSGSSIKQYGADKLCRALVTTATTFVGGSTLTWLDLARNDIGDKGAEAVASYLSAEGARPGNGQALRHVNISGNSISSDGLAKLAAAVTGTSGGCRLETCILSSNRLSRDENGSESNGGRRSLVSLVQAVNATLRTLEVADCGLGPADADALAASWATAPSGLTALDLSSNAVSDVGATALGRVLVNGGCPALESLDLSRNDIGDPGAVALGEAACAQACRLKLLDVTDNRIGDDGAIALSLAIDPSAGLTELHHSSNAIGLSGLEAISRRSLTARLSAEHRPAG